MIHTITFNPSVDYYIMVDSIQIGEINRFDKSRYTAAGKGINCSKIMDLYGIESKAIYFSGNSTGVYINHHLQKYSNIIICPIENDLPTRINIKIIGHEETAFNSIGPTISETAKEKLLQEIDKFCEGDYVIISGSLPKNISKEYVRQICCRAQKAKSRVILDVPDFNKEDLKDLDIYLIKPNIDEFKYLLGNSTIDYTNYREYVDDLHQNGVKNVLLSLGSKGAYYSGEHGKYEIKVPEVEMYSSVGAGDSMLAAFVGLLSQGKGILEALQYSCATGTAMVMSEDLPTRELIKKVISKIRLIPDIEREGK